MSKVIDFNQWKSKNAKDEGDELIVRFMGEALNFLRVLARQRGVSESELISDALSLEGWLQATVEAGETIYVKRKGQMYKVNLRK